MIAVTWETKGAKRYADEWSVATMFKKEQMIEPKSISLGSFFGDRLSEYCSTSLCHSLVLQQAIRQPFAAVVNPEKLHKLI